MPIVVSATTGCAFSDLQTEFYARGFSYLNDDEPGRTRAKNWLNEAYLEDICAGNNWDFLKTSTSGTAPLSITDLDSVVSVVDTTTLTQLEYANLREIVDSDPTQVTDATPTNWYLSDQTTLAVYPLNTSDTITVNYYAIPSELSGDTDTTAIPKRWCGLIVDAAVIRAYVDSDNFDAANQLQARFDRRFESMQATEFVRTDEPDYIDQTESW